MAGPSATIAESNLLFGVLALQMDFIAADQLVAATKAWVGEKQTPLAEILVRDGALGNERRGLLEPLVAEHIRRHGNDPRQSLAALSSVGNLKTHLECIEDGDLQQTLQVLGSQPTPAELDAALSTGARSSSGARFRILRSHAEGGLGKVFVAHDEELGRDVALKEIKPAYADDAESRSRFVREAEITGGLEHPSIVPVYGLGQYADGRPYYAMRFIQGDSLKEAIAAFHAPGVRGAQGQPKKTGAERNLELRRLLQRFIDVCEAIEYAHARGVLHRDLKPGNIMLGKYGETLVVDWGLARARGAQREPGEHPSPDQESVLQPRSGDTSATQMGSAIGTPAYMPPEQALGRLDLLGPASDVYSLGATLYCLLTGKPPVEGSHTAEVLSRVIEGRITPFREHSRGIPRPLAAICLKALAREPAERYASARALAADLEKWLADEAVAALPESAYVRLGRWMRRNRHWVQAGGIALVLVAAAACGAYFYQRQTAAENLQLASRNSKLAQEEQAARKDAEAKADSLRTALAQNYFMRGVAEFEANRTEVGTLDLQRAWVMLPQDHVLKPHYQHVLLDRIQASGGGLAFPLRHEGAVLAVAYSPQGDRVLTGSADKSAQLWDARTGAPLGKPMLHDDPVHVAAFDPRGDRVVTVSFGKSARLWDARTGAPLGKPLTTDGRVAMVAFSPRGDRVATATTFRRAEQWDAGTGARLGYAMSHVKDITALVYSPQGDRLLTGSTDGTARLWDARTGEPWAKPMPDERNRKVSAAAFSPEGNRVLVVYDDGEVQLWNALTGTKRGERMKDSFFLNVTGVAFNPQGNRLLTASTYGSVQLSDARTFARPASLSTTNETSSTAVFSPQGDKVLTGNRENSARLWNARTVDHLGEPMRHGDRVTAVAFSPRGDRVLTGSEDRTARLWDLPASATPGTGMLHFDNVAAAALSPSGDCVLISKWDNAARIIDASSGMPRGAPLAHEGQIQAVAFSPQGDRVLTGDDDGTARLWDARTGAPLSKPLQFDDKVAVVGFDPAENGMFIGTASGDVHAWNLKGLDISGAPLRHVDEMQAVAYSPQGDKLLTMCRGNEVKLWHKKTGASLLLRHAERVSAIAFSPRGDRVLTGSEDQTARLWNAETGALLGEPLRHSDKVNAVAFSPRGDRVLTGSNDRTARLWNAQTGAPLGEPLWHESGVTAVAFSPRGDRMLTGTHEHGARLWHAHTGVALGRHLRSSPDVKSIALSLSGDRALIVGSIEAHIWNIDAPPVPDDVTTYVELHAGRAVDSTGNARTLGATELRERRHALEQGDAAWFAEMRRRLDRRVVDYQRAGWWAAVEHGDRFAARSYAKLLQNAAGLDPVTQKLMKLALDTDERLPLNGDFEAFGPTNGPHFWKVRTWTLQDGIARLEPNPLIGGYSLMLHGALSKIAIVCSQEIAVTPQTDYVASCRVRTRDVSSLTTGTFGAGLVLRGRTERSESLTATNDWKTLTLRFNSGDDASIELGLQLGDDAKHITGFAWFDDIKILQAPVE